MATTTSTKVTKTKKKVNTETIDAEIVKEQPTTTKLAAPAVKVRKGAFIAEDGTVNLAVLSDEQVAKCREITKNLSPKVVGSVANYGIELQNKLANSGKAFLTATKASHTGEIGEIMSELLVNLNKINLKDVQDPNAFVRVLQKIPLLNKLVPSIQKTLAKYQTIEEGIQHIEENIKATQLMANADNNSLQQMFNETLTYISQMENCIVAGTLALDDAKAELVKMQNEEVGQLDISDQNAYINALEKKVHDLQAVRQIAKHNLMEIRMIQQNNITACDNAQSMMALTIPAFRTQMSIAVALQHQKDNIDVYNAIRNKTSEAIVANSQSLYDNTVAVTQANNQTVISFDAIMKSAETIKKTIEKVREIEASAKSQRDEEARKFAQLERDIESISTGTAALVDTATKGITL